jgi:hypothetical protein
MHDYRGGPEWAAWLEHSALAQAMRGGVSLYPAVETLHILGFACLIGGIFVFDLRLLGLGRGIAPAALAAITLPVAGGGLAVAAAAGSLLFVTEAVAYLHNPLFLAKQAAIILGLANIALFHWRFRGGLRQWPAGTALPRAARIAGLVSLATWVAVLVCGRAIAYV